MTAILHRLRSISVPGSFELLPLFCCYSHPDAAGFRWGSDALAPQLLHAGADRGEIISGAHAVYPLAPQLFETRADHRKIVGGAKSDHVSSLRLF
jgi:hypothetical protein